MVYRHTHFSATKMIRIWIVAKWVYKYELENKEFLIGKICVTEFCKTIPFKMAILK